MRETQLVNVELRDIETFLVLAEERHFGKTAQQLHLSPARVTQRIQALERAIGGRLFDRSSRTVRITPLGSRLRPQLHDAYSRLSEALDTARSAATSPAGPVIIGFSATTSGAELNALVRELERTQPELDVILREVPIQEPLNALREASVDIMVNWQLFDQPEFTRGPNLGSYRMVVLVAADHPLTQQAAVRFDDVAAYELNDMPRLSDQMTRPFFPRTNSRGEPVRTRPMNTWQESLSSAARGTTVHITAEHMRGRLGRNDLRTLPITDLPPVTLGLLWYTAHDNARIRATAAAATRLFGPDRRPA